MVVLGGGVRRECGLGGGQGPGSAQTLVLSLLLTGGESGANFGVREAGIWRQPGRQMKHPDPEDQPLPEAGAKSGSEAGRSRHRPASKVQLAPDGPSGAGHGGRGRGAVRNAGDWGWVGRLLLRVMGEREGLVKR